MTPLWKFTPGASAVLIDVPHAGTHMPPPMRNALTAQALALPDTDWHVDALYDFAPAAGASLLAATHARYVVDLNRDPANVPLYPGADNTEICPSRTFANDRVWREGVAPSPGETARRVEAYWRPYHAKLAETVAAIRARHGFCILLDGHSIRSEVPRFFAGRLPDLNLGTADGASCDPELQRIAAAALARDDRFGHVVNGRFKGGYITRQYGRPADGVHGLQLEMAISAYADEAAPERFDAARAGPLAAVLRGLVEALLAWRPR